MQVAVCVKSVPDSSLSLVLNQQGNDIIRDQVTYLFNPPDRAALEVALRIKDEHPDSTVTVVSLGPPKTQAVLRKCLSLGADKAVLLWDDVFHGIDAFNTSQVLVAFLKTLQPDLVFCGAFSHDRGTAQVGPCLGEWLETPHFSNVAGVYVSTSGTGVRFERKVENGGREKWECSMPVVLTVPVSYFPLRYPPLPNWIQGFEGQVVQMDARQLGLNRGQIGSRAARIKRKALSPARPRPKRIYIPDASLSAEERMALMLSGGVQKKASEYVEGEPGEVAAEFVRYVSQVLL